MQSIGLAAAVAWIEQLLLGPLATLVATIAVAALGFMLLDGRANWRYGMRMLLGCFILFGASTIVSGLMSSVSLSADIRGQSVEADVVAPSPRAPEVYDPYAGAALPRDW